MWDKSVPSITIKLYPLTVAGVILLSSLSLGSWGLWWFQVYPPGWRSDPSDALEPTFAVPDPLSSPSDPLVWSPSVLDSPEVNSPEIDSDVPPEAHPTVSPAPEITANTSTPDQLVAGTPSQTVPTVISNMAVLRVGNQTPHPVRIALLQRAEQSPSAKEELNSSANSPLKNSSINSPVTDFPAAAPQSPPQDPVHWDFEPGEGGYQGLILSLPKGDLKLETGDVLVAFAQDGSRRYWGPYVVGETSLPYWNAERSEWQLLLQP